MLLQNNLSCPDCKQHSVYETFEESSIIYSCENCGWSKIEENFFYITAWDVEIRQALAPVDILHSILDHSDNVKIIRPILNGISYLSSFPDASDEYLRSQIDIAHQIYLKQMIVLSVSYLELMLKDFFRCQFIANPSRMNRHLATDGKGKAFVSLNEVIEEPSKNTLLFKLAEKAASNAVDPKFDKTIAEIMKKYEIDFEKPIIDDIRNLNELRNRVVHEVTQEKITIKQVYEAFGINMVLLYILEQASIKAKVPYVDECGFLVNIESKIKQGKILG